MDEEEGGRGAYLDIYFMMAYQLILYADEDISLRHVGSFLQQVFYLGSCGSPFLPTLLPVHVSMDSSCLMSNLFRRRLNGVYK